MKALYEHTTPLSATRRALSRHCRFSISETIRGRDGQLVFLSRAKLPQIDSCDFSSDGWGKVLNLFRSTEQGLLLWVSKLTTVGDVDLLQGFPTDDGEVWLQYKIVFIFRPDMISLTL